MNTSRELSHSLLRTRRLIRFDAIALDETSMPLRRPLAAVPTMPTAKQLHAVQAYPTP